MIYLFDDLEDWTTRIVDVLDSEGPVLVVMKTVPGLTDRRSNPPPGERSMPLARAALRAGG